MIQLLYLVLFIEGAVALLLMVKIGPLRGMAMKGLDQLKSGKGPATVKTLACTMSVILVSSVASILKIQNRGVKLGTVTPMDQVLWRTHLLEALLLGMSISVQDQGFKAKFNAFPMDENLEEFYFCQWNHILPFK